MDDRYLVHLFVAGGWCARREFEFLKDANAYFDAYTTPNPDCFFAVLFSPERHILRTFTHPLSD